MSALNTRQRATINGALACLHSNGYDVAPIQRMAASLMASGVHPMDAYQQIIPPFVSSDAGTMAKLDRICLLIEKSDNPSVAHYDQALRNYIETGDDAALAPIEGMATRDMVALAVKAGDIAQADVDAGRIDWEGIGMDASAAAAFASPPLPIEIPAPAAPAQTFAFVPPGTQRPEQETSMTHYTTPEGGIAKAYTGYQARAYAQKPISDAAAQQGYGRGTGPSARATAPVPGYVYNPMTGGYQRLYTGENARSASSTPLTDEQAAAGVM